MGGIGGEGVCFHMKVTSKLVISLRALKFSIFTQLALRVVRKEIFIQKRNQRRHNKLEYGLLCR